MEKKTSSPINIAFSLALITSTILVLFTILFRIFISYTFQVYSVSYLYIVLCIIFPIILLIGSKLPTLHIIFDMNRPINNSKLLILYANILFLVFSLLFLNTYSIDYLLTSLFFLYVCILIFYEKQDKSSPSTHTSTGFLYKYWPVIFSMGFLFLFSNTFFIKTLSSYFSGLKDTYHNSKTIFLSLVITITFVFYALFYKNTRSKIFYNKWISILICLSPILLINLENSFDIEHYNPYLGPAIAVLHGKIPLIDVFGQYGLNYLIFTAAFLFLPNNYAVAALIVSGLNVIYLITLLFLLKKIIKNTLHFFVIGIPCIFGLYFSNIFPPNIFPSYWAMRFLPCTLFLLYLINQIGKPKNHFKITVPFILLFNFFWSFDSFVYALFLYCFYEFIANKYLLRAVVKATKSLLITLLYIAISFFFYFVIFEKMPDYKLYLINILNYINPENEIGIITRHSVSGFSMDYIQAFRISFVILFNFTLFYIKILYPSQLNRKNILFNQISILSFCSIIFLAYTASRPTLSDTSSLFYISFLAGIYYISYRTHNFWISISGKTILWLTSTAFIISFFCNILYIKPSAATINDNLISSLIHKNFNIKDKFIYNLLNFCTKIASDPLLGHTANKEEISLGRHNPCPEYIQPEIKALIKKWYPHENKILFFHKHLVQTLIENQKSHKFLLNPINDNMFPELTKLTLEKLKKSIQIGDVLIVDKKLNVYEMDLISLQMIVKNFTVKLIDETKNFQVFQLNKKEGLLSDLNFPLYFINHIILKNNTPTEEIEDSFKSINDDFSSIQIDLKKPIKIDFARIWKRLPDQNPSFFEKKIDFIKIFNIEASLDGIAWDLIASKNNFELKDKHYIEVMFPTNIYRYIRINFLDQNKSIYIHRIDVFSLQNSANK